MIDQTLDARYKALSDAKMPNYPGVSHFGRNEHGYDLGGEDGDGDIPDDSEDFGDGAPGRAFVQTALKIWAAGWQRFDVATASVVFNIDAELICEIMPPPVNYAGLDPVDMNDFNNAVQLIATQRDRWNEGESSIISSTVAEVAALMNVSEDAVKKAVEGHYWMMLGDERDGSPTIEHEGE